MDGAERTPSACIAWARETYARMQPFIAAGRYVNYLGDDETGDPGRRCIRTQLPAAPGDQDQVRSEELLPHEPEHPAAGLKLGRAMPLLYRPARAQDLQRAGELVVSSINDLCERHGFGPMAAVRPPDFSAFSLRDDPDGLWVAEDGGEILGFAFSWVCGDLWFLAQLFVSPGQQGRGIGQELLRRTLEHAQTRERRHQGAHHLLLQQRIAGAVYSTRTVPAVSDLQFQGRARDVDGSPARQRNCTVRRSRALPPTFAPSRRSMLGPWG